MSSYIIAGSADSLDTAYCQQIARRIKAKYTNIDFRIVIKHPSQWQIYLNQICRIYGFANKSNPIIYTYHGKIIGNKQAFIKNASKYFGLNQQLLVLTNLTTNINEKLANQQLQKKNKAKNNVKTLQQIIWQTYDRLLKQGLLKYSLKISKQFLINGIQYYFNEISDLCPQKHFIKNLQIKIQNQNIQASNIDLMALSIQDQTPIQQLPNQPKQPFVTTNQNQQLMQRMSQASKTNRLHSSVMSKDEDSKLYKQSSQQKHKIDQQYDDVTDYLDINMENYSICQLGDRFYLAFQQLNHSHLPGQMIFYYCQSQTGGNTIRMYYDGRPVIGHHTFALQVHFDDDKQQKNIDETPSQSKNNVDDQQQFSSKPLSKIGQKIEQHKLQTQQIQPHQIPQQTQLHNQQVMQLQSQNNQEIPKSAQNNQQQQKVQNIQQKQISQTSSDLNLISNLNYHSLYILKPLSLMQLKYILYLINQTNTIACLQFLPQNPNPKVKLYNRGMLLDTKDSFFPVQSFIYKQMEDSNYQKIILPQQNQKQKSSSKIQFTKIHNLGYTHLYYPFGQNISEEELVKVFKIGIGDILNLQDTLKKQIGYNLIISKKYALIIALVQPYRVYGTNSLYYDGLAYLGYIQIAKLVQGYMLKPSKINTGQSIRQSLAYCSAWNILDQF